MNDENKASQQFSSEPDKQQASDNKTAARRPVIHLDPSKVPPQLHLLIPYAEKWGIGDKELRRKLLHEASLTELEELNKVVSSASHDIVRALNFPPLNEPSSLEGEVFADLLMASGGAGAILDEVHWRDQPQKDVKASNKMAFEESVVEPRGKDWLKKIGWPENYPAVKLDPGKIPPELHFLIPYIEKWWTQDDYIRTTLIRVATDEELEEFVVGIKQFGIREISRLALKMFYDEERHEEGGILLELVQQAESAEHELKTRQGHTPFQESKSE